jgi:Glycosyl hydrolase family 76
MSMSAASTTSRFVTGPVALAVCAAVCCACLAPIATADAAHGAAAAEYLQLAERGVENARQRWRAGNWYVERLHDRDRYPLATIWGIVPLFETLDAVQIAAPSPTHAAAVKAFVRGAESYFDRQLRPTPGFAPYPRDRGQPRTWFDDNGWWGLAFLDAYRATHEARDLRDAERAFAFIAAQGWDARGGGGIWWNTSHPYRSGPALASDSLLGALLYQLTHRSFYLTQVEKFLAWADASFLTEDRLYAQNDHDGTPTPYVEGPLVEAHQVLCESGRQSACARARELADACWQRFAERLNMGPQFDAIYLHWMLAYGTQTGDARWRALATRMATRARANAASGEDLYLRAWDGTPITQHQAQRNMLQTDAATLELFAWLAAGG